MNATPSNSSAIPVPADMTAQKVIEMFVVELTLPVCDDDARINEQITKQRSRRQRDLNSTDGNKRIEAQNWHDHIVWLTQRRAQLLDLVYAQFKYLADLGVHLAGSSQSSLVLTPQMHQDLGNMARQSCRLDDALTDRFIDCYTKEIGWSKGQAPPPPQAAVIEGLSATLRPKSIFLRWSHPQGDCEKVLIYRSEKPVGASGQPGKEEDPLGETTADFYEDHAVPPGRWYYRVRAVHGAVKGVESVFFIAFPGEVEEAQATFADGKTSLTWRRPSKNATVWVFRRENAPPEIRRQGDDPAAVSPTVQRFCGQADRFEDICLREGVMYYYLLVSDFGQGVLTKGVLRQAEVPKPPPAVPWVKATYVHRASQDAVEVVWDAAQAGGAMNYRLVRREGDTAPDRPDGQKDLIIDKSTSALKVTDGKTIIPGKRYTYAVFTLSGDVPSRVGTASNPVDVCPEVTGVKVTAGNQTVVLEWRPPANVDHIVVRRLLNEYPTDIKDGSLVPVTGTTTATDSGLCNGCHYRYRIFSVYRSIAGAEVLSHGYCADAVPEGHPEMPQRFNVVPEGTGVVCTWSPPSYGHVVIRRLSAPHAYRPGARFNAAGLDTLGDPVVIEPPKSGRTEGPTGAPLASTVDRSPTIASPYYAIFAVAGSNAIAGEVKPCLLVQDVADLRVARTPSGFVLTWSWPHGCDTAEVVRRVADWPWRYDDPDALGTPVTCTRKAYDDAGARFLDPLHPKNVPSIHYTVYAKASVGSQFFHAPGNSRGCRKRVPVEAWTVLQYQITCPERGPYRGTHIHLSWAVDHPMPGFQGFVLMADKERVPGMLNEGLRLFPPPESPPIVSSGEAWVSLERIQREQWGHFFCKVFVADPVQSDCTLIIHPNTCARLTDTGRKDEITVSRGGRHYQAGTPRTIICPFDFQEFPVEDLAYGHPDRPDRIKATYTRTERLWGRLRGRRKPKIVEKGGTSYRQKFCPQGHLLPVTADRQESLTIGLIGAKYSGKTHYVGALVNRLFERTGEDLGIAAWGLTDETNTRYEEDFNKPLFGEHRELKMTSGTPSPLIYEVRHDLPGRDQSRSVNLALYETAGENLKNPVVAREMVKYLRVAAGVILLVDPLQIEGVRQRLPAGLAKPAASAFATPVGIINNIRGILEEQQVNAVLPIPVAIVLAKCDVLRDAGLIESNRLWSMEDKRHTGYFHRDWHEDMSGMMGEYLRRWDLGAYNTAVKQFPRHAFFGVSSTGCASRGQKFEFVSPWRVEDPLVWLLTELGVLPTKEEHDS